MVKTLDQVSKYVLETRGLLLNQPDNYPDNFVADAIHVLQSSSVEKFNDAIKIFGQQLNTNMALNSTLPSGGVGTKTAYAICFQPACSVDFNSTANFKKLLAYARKLYSDFTRDGSWDKALTKVPPSGFTAANLSGSSLDWSIQRCFNCGDPNHKLKDCPQAPNEATINENRAKYRAASKGKSKSKAKRSKFAPPDDEDPRTEKMIGGKLMKFHPNWTNPSNGKTQ